MRTWQETAGPLAGSRAYVYQSALAPKLGSRLGERLAPRRGSMESIFPKA